MKKFKPGDRVSFLNDVGGGVISSIEDDVAMVESEDGFDIPYPLEELVLVKSREEQEKAYKLSDSVVDGFVEKRILSGEEKKKEDEFERKFRHLPPIRRKEDILEVDLHIHQLIDDERGLEPFQMIEIQMKHFERMMESAIRDRKTRVVFIHGKGQGVLKNEIRKALEFYPQCSYQDAPFHTYGYHGATEVIIHQN